ncbi:Anaphase-promoting complex (APC), subunit 4 [Phaffia rhodozyma]|uniref:Anaphase-promoting complex subunit 4 n=1 Tax=Phaffia rhodozyma TaxID=264483 RepID=A0A0F7SUA3_PHARH|nr:Anaphase-promoting complex (APC), subunit 4 [Phaffia rhodozyma]
MSILESQSFTLLSTVSLPSQCYLHLQASCPTMDLVALITYDTKKDPNLTKAKIELRRLSGGPPVWTAQMEGKVAGLAWRFDGLCLAVYVPEVSHLRILSVHNGSVVREVAVPQYTRYKDKETEKNPMDEFWSGFKMEWKSVSVNNPIDGRGSILSNKEQIIGSTFNIIYDLPLVTPVPPSKKPSISPYFPMMMRSNLPSKSKQSPLLTPALPSLLASPLPPSPANPVPLSLLTLSLISAPTQRFLSGTYPLPPTSPIPPLGPTNGVEHSIPKVVEEFTKSTSAIEELIRGAVESIEGLETEWNSREGGGGAAKEWIGVLYDVGKRFGERIDPPTDLTRLLMIGRGSDSITNFIGGQLTSRSLGRWESSTLNSLMAIQNACYQNIVPAFERIIIFLDEIFGWSRWTTKYGILNLDPGQVEKALNLAKHAVLTLCQLEKIASEERTRFVEFAKWLKYELAVASSQDPSVELNHSPSHDVLVVADYLQSSFLRSPVTPFLESRPPEQHRPSIKIPTSIDLSSVPSLDDTISSTLDALNSSASFASKYSLSNSSSKIPLGTKGRTSLDAQVSRYNTSSRDERLRSAILGRRKVSSGLSGLTSNEGNSYSDRSSSLMDLSSMLVDIEQNSSLSQSAVHNLTQLTGRVEDEQEGYRLEDIVVELIGVFREILESALPVSGESSAAREDPQSRKLEDVNMELMFREWSDDANTSTSNDPSRSYVAFVASQTTSQLTPTSLLWIMYRSSDTPAIVHVSSFQLAVQIEDGLVCPCDVVDMDFFNSEELILVVDVRTPEGPKILLGSIAYTTSEYADISASDSGSVLSPGEALRTALHIPNPLPSLCQSYLPLTRARHIASLDRLPRSSPHGDPARPAVTLALNGNPSRMTGSLLTWEGRELIVFDMAEDEDGEEEEEEEGEDNMDYQ